MKNHLYLSAVLAGALGFAACTSDSPAPEGSTDTVASETVSFRVTGMT